MGKYRKRKGKIKVWLVILLVVGVIALVIAGGLIWASRGLKELQEMVIADVEFENLRDGIYKGEYRGTKDSFRNVTVEVTVTTGSVTEIRVTGGGLAGDKQTTALRGGLSIDDLFGEVIKAQSLQVDVISGATVTSNAHLKAVENALKQAESR